MRSWRFSQENVLHATFGRHAQVHVRLQETGEPLPGVALYSVLGDLGSEVCLCVVLGRQASCLTTLTNQSRASKVAQRSFSLTATATVHSTQFSTVVHVRDPDAALLARLLERHWIHRCWGMTKSRNDCFLGEVAVLLGPCLPKL